MEDSISCHQHCSPRKFNSGLVDYFYEENEAWDRLCFANKGRDILHKAPTIDDRSEEERSSSTKERSEEERSLAEPMSLRLLSGFWDEDSSESASA